VLYELPFGAEMAALSPQEVAAEVLARGLGVRHVVVGADFRFGKGRAGDAAALKALGAAAGFAVTVAPLVSDARGDFSSTAIREALVAGRPEEAARILGHWHRIEGAVEHGDKRGRELGFPTANMSLAGLLPPRFGVYAVLVDVLTGPHRGRYRGAASIGERPTFGAKAANLEVHLFDFAGDLYGEVLSVALVAWLRPEIRFDGAEPLVAQMRRDAAEARAHLAGLA
jgi:riboflavin kinase/FMN adenylyltransferase